MSYNGHKNYAMWNVSLWINNDKGLYNMARDYCRRNNRRDAARMMRDDLADMGITKTPDGANYTITAIQAAMIGM